MKKTLFIAFLFPTLCIASGDKLDSLEVNYFEDKGFEMDSTYNTELFDFVCQWIEVPYKYGGRSQEGVDCSSLSKELYNKVYQTSLTGTSSSLYTTCEPISKEDLQEGDLVFFKIYNDKISHVGVYMGQNRFVHASTKLGVTINNLDESYYAKRFFAGGRIPVLAESE